MSPGRRVEVESSGIIDAPLEKLWDLVSDFSNLAHWHPDVTECRLESGSARQAGAVRSVRLRNGISIRRPHGTRGQRNSMLICYRCAKSACPI